MHPVLFHIFGFPIHSYGVMLALSFITGIILSSWLAQKRGLDPGVVSDIGFWIIISAVIGARLYYVFLHFEEFRGNYTSIFNPFQDGNFGIGGLVMYGGFIGAIAASAIYFKLKKIPVLPYGDVLAPSIALGIFITRIGCFMNGCCYGKPADNCWCSVSYPPETQSPANFFQIQHHAEALYPSQLFLSFGGLTIAIILFIAMRKKFFNGFIFYLCGVLYAVLRFLVDFTRHYRNDELIGILSHNQIVCIVLFIVFGGLILKGFLFSNEPEDIPAG